MERYSRDRLEFLERHWQFAIGGNKLAVYFEVNGQKYPGVTVRWKHNWLSLIVCDCMNSVKFFFTQFIFKRRQIRNRFNVCPWSVSQRSESSFPRNLITHVARGNFFSLDCCLHMSAHTLFTHNGLMCIIHKILSDSGQTSNTHRWITIRPTPFQKERSWRVISSGCSSITNPTPTVSKCLWSLSTLQIIIARTCIYVHIWRIKFNS